MKKTLLPLAILGLVFASPVFAKSVTNIVKVKGMESISEDGDHLELYTTKGTTFTIHIDYIDDKSFFTLTEAADKKSCIKITQTGSNFPYKIKAVKVSCPKKLPTIKN